MNTVSFNMPKDGLNQLHIAKGKELSLNVSKIVVNGDTLTVKRIRVRGNTSSYYRRKSLNIKTTKKSHFYTDTDTFALGKFYAISMNMDRNYIRNKISFAVLKLAGVHTPLNSYSDLAINGASEGLYLICYPPDEYAMKKLHATFIIRRGYGESMDKVNTAKEIDREHERELKKMFRSLYASSTLNKSGEELFNHISAILDLNSYFTWLAFNHLFQNADYADEAYFMWNPEKLRFEIIPWDFDDILKDQPHEGVTERGASHRDKLIFSLEDELDKKIASDAFLYERYLKAYSTLIATLTPEKLIAVMTGVFDELYPYYLREDIVAQSQFDLYGKTDLVKLEADLNSIYQYISMKVIGINKKIESATR
jgi:spore coat protein H